MNSISEASSQGPQFPKPQPTGFRRGKIHDLGIYFFSFFSCCCSGSVLTSDWESKASFFCPDPTHKMGIPPPAWCIENWGPRCSSWGPGFISLKTFRSVTHTVGIPYRFNRKKGVREKETNGDQRREAYNELLRSNQKVYKRDVNIRRALCVNDVWIQFKICSGRRGQLDSELQFFCFVFFNIVTELMV